MDRVKLEKEYFVTLLHDIVLKWHVKRSYVCDKLNISRITLWNWMSKEQVGPKTLSKYSDKVWELHVEMKAMQRT